MKHSDLAHIVAALTGRGVAFDRGLSDYEISQLERRMHVAFPPDLRRFLQYALPVSSGFPRWRSISEAELQARLAQPKRGVIADVKDGFWLDTWGIRPQRLDEACQLVERRMLFAPRLVPVFAHRMIPADPSAEGNPVFSLYGADIICVGQDLTDYFEKEFRIPKRSVVCAPPEHVRPPVPFWDEFDAQVLE